MTALPTAAARAAQETRGRARYDAWAAYWNDSWVVRHSMPGDPDLVTKEDITNCRTALQACLSYLDEIERHLPGSARQGQVRDVAEGDPAYRQEQGR